MKHTDGGASGISVISEVDFPGDSADPLQLSKPAALVRLFGCIPLPFRLVQKSRYLKRTDGLAAESPDRWAAQTCKICPVASHPHQKHIEEKYSI